MSPNLARDHGVLPGAILVVGEANFCGWGTGSRGGGVSRALGVEWARLRNYALVEAIGRSTYLNTCVRCTVSTTVRYNTTVEVEVRYFPSRPIS